MLGLKHTWVAVYSNKSALVESGCWLLDSIPSPTEGLQAPGQPEVTPETHNRTELLYVACRSVLPSPPNIFRFMHVCQVKVVIVLGL